MSAGVCKTPCSLTDCMRCSAERLPKDIVDVQLKADFTKDLYSPQSNFLYEPLYLYTVMIGLLYKATPLVASIDLQVLLRQRPYLMNSPLVSV